MKTRTQIWACDSFYVATVRTAINVFCREYWDQPRKPRDITADGTFGVRGGTRTYHIAHQPGSAAERPSWVVSVED